MGDPNKKELSDEEMDQFDEKRGSAMQAYSEVGDMSCLSVYTFSLQGEWEKAIELFTEAIKINPNSAVMFAKRGMCYLKISPQATAACVKVCPIKVDTKVNPVLSPGLLTGHTTQP